MGAAVLPWGLLEKPAASGFPGLGEADLFSRHVTKSVAPVGRIGLLRDNAKWAMLKRLSRAAFVSLLAVAGFPHAGSQAQNVTDVVEEQKVVIFELNGTKLYVPELWIWPDKARWQLPSGSFIKPEKSILPGDPPGTTYRVADAIALLPNAYEDRRRFPQLQPDFWVYRVEFRPGPRDIARLPRTSIDDLPTAVKTRLGLVDEDGFRRAGEGDTFYSAMPEDISLTGWPRTYNCNTPIRPDTGYSYCSAVGIAIEGLSVKYVWNGRQVPKSEWRRMSQRVQTLVNWLATPPDQRTSILER